jgi:hypothetical protein
MLGWAPIVTGVTGTASPWFGSEDELAPIGRSHWYHQSITEQAALAVGWSAGAARELGWNALGVDLYAYHPIWRLQGGPRRLRGGRMAAPALARVHFDNLASTSEITEVWHRLVGGTLVGLRWAAERDDVSAARQLVGVALHAIQDFYSHSTWIDEPGRRELTFLEMHGWAGGPAGAPAGNEPGPDLPAVMDDEPALSTGGFGAAGARLDHIHGRIGFTWPALTRAPALLVVPLVDTLLERTGRGEAGPTPSAPIVSGCAPCGLRYRGPGGINLDSHWQAPIGARTRGLDLTGDAAFETAIGLAERETRTWLTGLEQRLDGDPVTKAFWARVRDEPGQDWTRPFEDPALRPYDFIAAGHYPPNGTRASMRWFLRVELTGRHNRRRVAADLGFVERAGRILERWDLPGGRAVTVGPLTPDATRIELRAVAPGLSARGHAFRRAPRPEVLSLFDAEVGSGLHHDLAVLDHDRDRR